MAGSIFFGKTTSYVAGLGKAYGITQYNLNINEQVPFTVAELSNEHCKIESKKSLWPR